MYNQNGGFMNFNKLLLASVVTLGLVGSAVAKPVKNQQRNSGQSFANLISFPFKAVSFAVREVALPIVELPIKVAQKAFGSNQA